MPLEGQAKKDYMKAYAKKRREEGRPVEPEMFRENIDWAKAWDEQAAGKRFLSEVSSMYDLALIFHGADKKEEDSEAKKKGKKIVILKPAVSKIFDRKLTFWEWLVLRDVCRKDGFFLGRVVLNKDLLVPRVHQPVFDQLVQKDFDGVYHEGYTLSDVHKAFMNLRRGPMMDGTPPTTRERELLLLDPRGHLKSTIDGIDVVQWLLNVPDVRISLMTGEESLADTFRTEIKDYFTQIEGAEPTDLQLLFPEYVLRGRVSSRGTSLRCPARRHKQKEPSLWIKSLGGSLSGWHCDVQKGDDLITDENSNTKDTRQKIKLKVDGSKNVPDGWAFIDNLGTRYWTDDWYGGRLASGSKLRYFCRPCWKVKPGYENTALKELTIDMVDILFPERMTGGVMTPESTQLAWEDLKDKLKDNETSFRNQQLNEPKDAEEEDPFRVTFSPDALTKHLCGKEKVDLQNGDIIISWDWAYSDHARSDWSVGVAAQIYQNELGEWGIFVLEVIYDRWNPTKLANNVLMLNKKWNPKFTLIEETNSADLFKVILKQAAWEKHISLDVIRWFKPDYSQGAKRNRIKSLELLLAKDLLWFVKGVWIDETFKQFTEYKGENSTSRRKDDIPDAVSFLVRCSPHLRTKQR